MPADLSRPRPPEALLTMEALTAPDRFVPAPELADWLKAAFVDPAGELHDPDHAHLANASLACLWTTAENRRQMRRIVAQAEIPAQSLRGSRWAKARAEQQLLEWFGTPPDFLLTFDALHAAEVDDVVFCALCDHELRHCAQAEDEYGAPRFNRETGEPVFALRGHDVSEFVGTVRRFGIEAAGPEATEMVIAAAQKPQIARAAIAQACGTCLLRAA